MCHEVLEVLARLQMMQQHVVWLAMHSSPLVEALPEPDYRERWLMASGHAVIGLLKFEQ
jgi:hypothetical protein